MRIVPVVSKTGKQLMPCSYWRCQDLLKKGRALRRFKAGIFYIQLKETFEAHNVDSWVLANWKVGGHIKPDRTDLVKLEPIQFHRRQLHKFQFEGGGVRKKYGGTVSLGIKRGSLVKHEKYGITYVGGTQNGKVSLHNIESGDRITQGANLKDLVVLCFNYWRTAFPPCPKGLGFPKPYSL